MCAKKIVWCIKLINLFTHKMLVTIFVVFLYRYDKFPDFTVVLQPFTKLFNAPNADPNHAPPIDSTLVTYDCFHFSQKGHALGKRYRYINNKNIYELLLLLFYFYCFKQIFVVKIQNINLMLNCC